MTPTRLRLLLPAGLSLLVAALPGCGSGNHLGRDASAGDRVDHAPDGHDGEGDLADAGGDLSSDGSDGADRADGAFSPPVSLIFDTDGNWTTRDTFYDFPYPSDLRKKPDGRLDLTGFPAPDGNANAQGLLSAAEQRTGFPTLSAAYFRFTGPLSPHPVPDDRSLNEPAVIAAEPSSPVLLVDIDPTSPDRGKLYPTAATTFDQDAYVPANLLAVGAVPGVVLPGNRTYAYVIRRSFNDAAGQPLAVDPGFGALKRGEAPGAMGMALKTLYAPLWETLGTIGVSLDEVAAATVFTTGNVVAETAALGDQVVAQTALDISNVAPAADVDQAGYCHLVAQIAYPQFQKGTPPFDTDGLFVTDDQGALVMQRVEIAPVTLTLPKQQMPDSGYPLLVYVHGSGGIASQVVDRGPVLVPNGPETPGQGPAYVIAPFGVAAAASAMPVNPERLMGASEYAYLNFGNLAAFRDTFRQGLIEQRLFIDALSRLAIDPSALGACTGPTLPAGATAFKFDVSRLVLMGQSMGGQYTNLISATEARVKASIPTGAGGYWTYFVLDSMAVPGALVANLLGSSPKLTYLHPGLHLTETVWEAADAIAYVPFISKRPLPGHDPKPIYEPVGLGDSYFATEDYDAMALAYGNQQAGMPVWDTMQTWLALEGRDGFATYPIADNLTSSTGARYTGVVVQYMGDGIYDPHAIAFQLDAVKYQYGCFLATFLKNGVATVPAPAPLGTPCPE